MLVSGGDHLVITHGTAWLDNRDNARLRRLVDAVTEREEGVRRHHGTGYLQAFIGGLEGGNPGTVDATHLAGAHTDGHVVLAINNRVRLDELCDPPGKQQVTDLGFRRRTLRHHLEIGRGNPAEVTVLHQQAAIDALEVERLRRRGRPFTAFEYADILLLGQHR